MLLLFYSLSIRTASAASSPWRGRMAEDALILLEGEATRAISPVVFAGDLVVLVDSESGVRIWAKNYCLPLDKDFRSVPAIPPDKLGRVPALFQGDQCLYLPYSTAIYSFAINSV